MKDILIKKEEYLNWIIFSLLFELEEQYQDIIIELEEELND